MRYISNKIDMEESYNSILNIGFLFVIILLIFLDLYHIIILQTNIKHIHLITTEVLLWQNRY